MRLEFRGPAVCQMAGFGSNREGRSAPPQERGALEWRHEAGRNDCNPGIAPHRRSELVRTNRQSTAASPRVCHESSQSAARQPQSRRCPARPLATRRTDRPAAPLPGDRGPRVLSRFAVHSATFRKPTGCCSVSYDPSKPEPPQRLTNASSFEDRSTASGIPVFMSNRSVGELRWAVSPGNEHVIRSVRSAASC